MNKSEVDEIYELLNLLRDGTNRNIIVYDNKASAGLLTSKLIDIMQEVSRDNEFGEIVEIYTRANALKEFDPESINKHIMPYAIADEVWDEVEEYYKGVLDGCYAAGDSNLVIALSNRNKALLGSY
jgi:hypothetical protein